MRKFIKVLSALLVVAICAQIIAPGTIVIGATPIVGNNAAMSALEGTTINGSVQETTLSALEIISNKAIEPEIVDISKGELSLIVEEVEESRSENTKHFRHADGSFTAAVYSEPVHYLNSSGEWQDIDNSLALNSKKKSIAGKSMYTPVASAFDIQVPQDFSNNQKLLIGKDGYTVGMGIKTISDNNVVTTSEQLINFNLDSVQAEITNNYNENSSNEKVATVATVNLNSTNITVEEANNQKMDLDNRVSAANYRNVFSGADLQYVITSNKIKENIIVKTKQTSYIYQFDIALDGLVPIAQDNGSIRLYKDADDTEPLFVIETPYMYDATEETSFDVSMTLNGNTLTVTADSEWINSDERVFPVVIDPTISYSGSSFQDATACHNLPLINYDTYQYVYAGNGLLSLRRTYMKFDLPTLPDCSIVTNAVLTLKQHNTIFDPDGKFIYAFDLSGKDSWSESSITWSNQPLSTDTNGPRDEGVKVIDYITAVDAEDYTYKLNLTKTVKNWYENNNNNGIMITSSDETKNGQPCFYSSDHSTSANHPKITIQYNTNIGLEDYWSYQTINMGRSGSAYVNNYNGNVTYVHSDLTMTGNLLPINISHVYNTYDTAVYSTYYNGMSVGSNFHLNIQELLIKENSSKYKHYDSDGTSHYYVENDDTDKITHEYDSTLELTVSDSGYIITDAKGNEKHFKTSGQLYKIVDSNGNSQTFTYTGAKITAVTDPSGRMATLSYNDYGQLVSVTDPAGRVTSYSYDGTASTSKITNITYPDSKRTKLEYSSDGLYKVTESDNSYTTFSYNSFTKRATEVCHYDKAGSVANQTCFKYTKTDASGRSSGNTIVYPDYANQPDKYNLYFFDSYGRATSVTNQDKQTLYSVYGDYSSENTNTYNKLFDSSQLQTISNNLLSNHGFELSGYWNVLQNESGSYDLVSDESSNGHKSLAMSLTSDTGVIEIGQDFVAVKGETYTVSLDVNFDTPDNFVSTGNNGFVFGFVYEIDGEWGTSSSMWITSTSGWERFTHTMTVPYGNLTNCHVFVELARITGTVHVDSIQVEKSGGARFYNLVENSDFSNAPGATTSPTGTVPYAWNMYNVDSVDGVQYAEDDFNGHRNYLYMIGTPTLAKEVVQSVPVNAGAGDVLIIGGRAAAYATVDAYNYHKFGIIAKLYNSATDENPTTVEIGFDRTIDNEHQTKATFVTLTEDCHHIVYSFVYYYHIDCASFDDAFIYVGSYGEHYDYSSNGQITESDNDEGTTTNYNYADNNIDVEEVTQTVSGVEQTVATYSYDDNHNVLTATNNIGTIIEYEYNDAGQITSQTTKYSNENNEVSEICESFEYYQGGNYIKSHTNETGGVTTYVYDNDTEGNNITKGLVTSVTDPNGNVTTYTYDPNTDELLSTSGEAEPSVISTTSFTYENNLPKTITRNGTTYSYVYDSQNRIASSKIGTHTLATNTYDSRNRLTGVYYANNTSHYLSYDSQDRLSGEAWNAIPVCQYYYNDNDRLAKLVDKVTNVSYQYDYAFYGLPFRVTGSDGTQTLYDYDRSGNLARLTFSDDNANIYSAKYYTNEKGMPEDVVIDTLDNALIHYNYDDFGRVESYSYGPIIRSFRYAENGTATNNQVIEIIDETKDGVTLQVYDIEYNADGSMHVHIENMDGQFYEYVYDDLGRVVEEFITDDLYSYTYDAGGNITSVKNWDETIHTFTYENYNWKDQLTRFDGKWIGYEASGNPYYYDGYTYTWQRGTQLANIYGDDETIRYIYDSQGKRVQKTVNDVVTTYLYSDDMLMRQTDGTNTIDFQYDAGGQMIGFVYNGTPYYYLRNIMNDVSGIVDANGTVVAKYRYDAYGNTIYSTGDMAEINPIRYRGYYFDAETSWYYLESRYYNPEWRRFINSDSLFVAGDAITGSNMYAYCNGDPISYVDENGNAAVENDFVKVTRPIVDAVTIAGWIAPEAVANKLINKDFGGGTNDFSYFSESNPLFEEVMPFFTNELLYYADYIIAPLVSKLTGKADWKDRVYETDKGLQYILWPYTMSMGARLGAFFLEFFPDDSMTPNYSTQEGQYQWQHNMGYNWYYDAFFSLGGPIKKLIYDFESTNNEGETKYYAVWCWKGDYWNLGPGAEIGIYVQKDEQRAKRGFYDIDKDNLKVKTYMKVEHNGYYAKIKQTNWWITMFMPWKGQRINLEDLTVWQAVSFDIPVGKKDDNGTPYINDYSNHDNLNLFDSFVNSEWSQKINNGSEENLKWGPTPPENAGWDYLDSDGSYYGNFQFYIKF